MLHRTALHRKRLRKGTHHCAHLQAAWNKYGEASFVFAAIEVIPDGEDLLAAEDVWLSAHYGKEYCYNTGRTAAAPWRGVYGAANPAYGRKLSEENKAQISSTLKATYAAAPENHPRLGKAHTEEARKKMSDSRIGKMAGEKHYRYGKTVSEEVRKKIGDTQRGKPKSPGRRITPEGRAKIAAAAAAGKYSHWEGRNHTQESREKMGRPIVAISPEGAETEHAIQSALCEQLGVFMPTIHRAIKSGKPISRGKIAGWSFKYA